MKDTIFLAQRSEPATVTDKQTITDLKDTLQANSKTCVGMAANMIGVKKRIIVYARHTRGDDCIFASCNKPICCRLYNSITITTRIIDGIATCHCDARQA